MKVRGMSVLILILLLLNVCVYAGVPPKGLQGIKVIKGIRTPPAPVVNSRIVSSISHAVTAAHVPALPSAATTITPIHNIPTITSGTSGLPHSAAIPNVQALQTMSLPVVKEPEVLVVNPNDLVKQNPFATETHKMARQLTDLSYPEIAERLDRLMQRHPEILNNPEYSKPDSTRIVNLPQAPYTADQIAMVAAIENQPQWTWYAQKRLGRIGDSVYYALKNGHEDLANWILHDYNESINGALYEALLLDDMKMAEYIYHTYQVDVNKITETLESSLLIRMSEKSAKGVNWLLEHGAIISKNNYWYNELDAAIRGNRTDVIEILYEHGMDLSDALSNENVILFFRPQCVEKLIALGVPAKQLVNRAQAVVLQTDLTQEESAAAYQSYSIISEAYHEDTMHRVDEFLHRRRP